MNIIETIDKSIYNLIIKSLSINMTLIMRFISHLGSAITLITLTILFLIVLKNKRNSKFIILNLILSFVINRILKFLIARQRPHELMLTVEKGYSFPSGHAMVSMAFYGFIIYLIYKNIKNNKIKYPLTIFISIIILLIGISRIYLGVHYTTDIIGGFIIGYIYLAFFIKYIYNNKILKKSF